jgi:hypothetical protein
MSFNMIPVFATTSLSADGGNLTTQLIYAALAAIAIGVAVMVGEGFFQRKAIITMLHAAAASLGGFAIIAGVLTWYNGTAALCKLRLQVLGVPCLVLVLPRPV